MKGTIPPWKYNKFIFFGFREGNADTELSKLLKTDEQLRIYNR
jgi:hypothetical protein